MRSLRSFIHSTLRKEEMEALNLARERLHIPIDEIKNIQEVKVRKLIDYAKNNSSYYKRVLKNVSYENLNDLKKLPFLTKEIIKNEYDGIICKSDFAYLKKDSTSGSTSQATYFGTDLRSFNTKRARLDRANEMNGKYKYLDKILVFWGAERDLLNKWDIRKFYNHHIKHARVISTYHMTKEDINKNLDFINKWKPCLVVGYPSALNFMADFISHNPGILKHYPKAIISAGEMLYETQRENIETQFCSEVFNRYGSREFTQIACECSSHSGLHYDAEDLIIEVVDDHGNPCPS